MKKILGLALILFASVAALAQERVIEKEEFDKVFGNGKSKMDSKPHRTTIIWEFRTEGRPELDNQSKLIDEYLPKVGRRSISEANPKTGTPQIETIFMGDKKYRREGNGEWKLGISDPPYTYQNPIKYLSNEEEYKFLGSEKSDNQNTTVYSWTIRRKYIDEKTNAEVLSIITTKCWLKENGEFLKTENLQERRTSEKVFSVKRTDIYEIDPNIKIEAPILTSIK
ncbi:MAG: hypothetical protein WA584_23045 [Pyrinomonadaceae bacterium]